MDILTELSHHVYPKHQNIWVGELSSPYINLAPAVLGVIGVAVDEGRILVCHLQGSDLRVHCRKFDKEMFSGT